MTSNTDPFTLTVQRCGPMAQDVLQQTATGDVAALFERSFYLRFGSSYICVGTCDFADGPVNVVTSAPAGTNWRASGLKPGDRAGLVDGRLRLSRHLTLICTAPVLWRPAPLAKTGLCPASPEILHNHFRQQPPVDGLAPQVFGAPNPPLQQAAPPLADLASWLSGALQGSKANLPLSAVRRLLGMGPGLTPSGDDFLGAMMIALSVLHETRSLPPLAAAIQQMAPGATNPISAQLLDAASKGLGSDAFHDVLAALQASDATHQTAALNRLVAMGHTSGWDALAGLYTTLKIWHSVRQTDTVAA